MTTMLQRRWSESIIGFGWDWMYPINKINQKGKEKAEKFTRILVKKNVLEIIKQINKATMMRLEGPIMNAKQAPSNFSFNGEAEIESSQPIPKKLKATSAFGNTTVTSRLFQEIILGTEMHFCISRHSNAFLLYS